MKSVTVALLGLFFIFNFVSCDRETITTDPSAALSFSTDTLLFDTVFTTIGSTTQVIKVYNENNSPISISSIDLLGGTSSQFRMAVDGDNGVHFEDVYIAAGDSLFIFVEVTVDPTNSNTPYVIEDHISFNTNGNEQTVLLTAWGQDAYFHVGGNNGDIYALPCGEVWNNDKPHVIYGIVAVDEGCTLTINAGTQVHVHNRGGLFVYKSSLLIQGELNNEVVFQGDRLESEYADVPGQWGIQYDFQGETGVGPGIFTISRGGIWIYQSPNTSIDYAIIKNGETGIQVDTTGSSGISVNITNTIIENMSGIGLWGQGAHISGKNLLVMNCGESCANLGIGGMYQFDNCSFVNYWNGGTRNAPAVYVSNYYEDINQNIQLRQLTNSFFRNCIMYGNSATLTDFNEFVLDLEDEANQQIAFKYCLLDTDLDVSDDGNRWEGIVNNQSPSFCDPNNGNFRIDQNSPRMLGFPFVFGTDLVGNETGDYKGCYDFTGSCN